MHTILPASINLHLFPELGIYDNFNLHTNYIVKSRTAYLTKDGKEDLCAPIYSIYNITEKEAA